MPHCVTTNITKESAPFGEYMIYDDARLIANQIINCACKRSDPDCQEFTDLVERIMTDWSKPVSEREINWENETRSIEELRR